MSPNSDAQAAAKPDYGTLLRLVLEVLLLVAFGVFLLWPQNSSSIVSLREFIVPQELTEISITVGEQSIRLMHDNAALSNNLEQELLPATAAEHWKLESGEGVNISRLNELLSALKTASFTLKSSAPSFEKIGLSPPALTLLIRGLRRDKKISVGARNDYLGAFYATLDDDKNVYLTAGHFMEAASRAKSEFNATDQGAAQATVPLEAQELE